MTSPEHLGPWVPIVDSRGNLSADHFNLHDVTWFNAPLPRVIHRCRAQTKGIIDLVEIERCRCGALRTSLQRRWFGRNTRRRFRLFSR